MSCISLHHMREKKKQLQPVLSISLAIIYDAAIRKMELKKKIYGCSHIETQYNLIAFLFETNLSKFSGLTALKFDYGVKQN